MFAILLLLICILIPLNFIVLAVETKIANWNNIFWGSFHVNFDVFRVERIFSNNNTALSFLIKWNLCKYRVSKVSSNKFLVKIMVIGNQKFEHACFNSFALDDKHWHLMFLFRIFFFNPWIWIANDWINNKIPVIQLILRSSLALIVIEREWISRLTWGISFNNSVTKCHMILSYIHITSSDGSSLSNTNIMNHRTSLNGFKILDQDSIFLKSANRKSHSNRDSKRKTFRNAYNQNHNSNNTNVNNFQNQSLIELLGIGNQHQQYQVNYLSKNNYDCCENCIFRHLLWCFSQLIFKRSSLFVQLEISLRSWSRKSGVFSYTTHNSSSCSRNNLRTSKKERIRVFFMIALLLKFIISRWLFSRRLSSWVIHGFINMNIHFLNENTICRNNITSLDIDQITNNKFFNGNFFLAAKLSSVDNYFIIVHIFLKWYKLRLFHPISKSAHKCSS